MAVAITQDNFEKEVMSSSIPVVVDVYASWCGPCQLMMPIIAELEKEFESRIKFVTMNVDETRDLTIHFGITSVPTFLFIKNKDVVARETGYMSKEVFKEKMESFLGK